MSKASSKAKVYGLASRIFIRDAHGDWAAGGKRFAEFYFLNDQVSPKNIELKTTHNGSTTVSGLFMRQGGNLRLRVVDEQENLDDNPLKIMSAPVADGGDWKTKWMKAFYVDSNASGKIKQSDEGDTVIGSGKAIPKWKSIASTITDVSRSSNKKMDTLFELQGLQKSIPLMLEISLFSGSKNVRFWVLVE
ncbi:MAG: hypothetical protein AAF975_09390 [Spirochaetota bacterium]